MKGPGTEVTCSSDPEQLRHDGIYPELVQTMLETIDLL
jgi:hypothetical protein